MGAGATKFTEQDVCNPLHSNIDANSILSQLEHLKALCDCKSLRAGIANPNSGVLQELITIIRDSTSDAEKELAADCVLYLSRDRDAKLHIANSQELLILLSQNFTMYNCMMTVVNIAVCEATHVHLLSQTIPLMNVVKASLNNPDCLRILSNVSITLKKNNLELFLSYGFIAPIAQILIAQIVEENNEIVYWSLSFMCNVSFHSEVANELKFLDVIPLMMRIMHHFSDMTALKAFIVICNLIGKDEPHANVGSLLQQHPEKFDLLLKLLTKTLDKDITATPGFNCYYYGIIRMRVICGAIRTLSVGDANKPIMLKTNVLQLLMRALKLFTDNAPELVVDINTFEHFAGGGGDDEDTAEVILEALLQLSFNFESDEIFRSEISKSEPYSGCLLSMLRYCTSDLYVSNMLSNEAIRQAGALLRPLK